MNKLEFIYSYIEQCNKIIISKDYEAAKTLQTEIISTFENEINNIKNELDNYSMAGFFQSNRKVDYLGDLKLLKQKLENYYFNIQEENQKREYELEIARLSQPILTASAEANQTVNNCIEISFSNLLQNLDELSEDKLSNNDKERIKELLFSLEGVKAAKDKVKFWEKAKDLLKYLLDKGVEVAIAILPYLLNGLQETISK